MFHQHHLELFYYVARYGGISGAVRHIPYGVGQPAISGQMAAFERQVGAPLFRRRPFQLTEQGRMIYDFIRPFHANLPALWTRVQGCPVYTLRVAAADTLGSEVLALIMQAAAPLPTGVRVELLTGRATDLEGWVQERRVRLAIMPAPRRVRSVCSRVLLHSGLRLLVPHKSKITAASHFWSRPTITAPLIGPPEADPVSRAFAQGLQGLRVEWTPAICVESPQTLMQLVAAGNGVGIGLDLPWLKLHPAVRGLPLAGFERVPLLALWRKPVDTLLASLLAAGEAAACRFRPTCSKLASLLLGPCLHLFAEGRVPLGGVA